MFNSKKPYNHKKIHENELRLPFEDNYFNFIELLAKDKSMKIHHRKLHRFAGEI